MLLEAWARFESSLPKCALSPNHMNNLRCAFYCGAGELFNGLAARMSPGHEPQASDMAFLDSIFDELKAFRAEVRANRAGLQ